MQINTLFILVPSYIVVVLRIGNLRLTMAFIHQDNAHLARTTTGSVVLQVSALELLARYSMNSGRATSVLSSLHEFRIQEAEQSGGKQWNWKYLRDQFNQKDLEGLYRRYDDKLRETLITIYITLLAVFSATHIIVIVASTYPELSEWHPTYLAIIMYTLRIIIPAVCLWKRLFEPMKKKWFLTPIIVTFIITVDLVITDVIIAITSSTTDVLISPAYSTMALLSLYIFLPMRNNYLAIFLGVFVSLSYVFVLAFSTYYANPTIVTMQLASDILFLVGVNLMGIYFRLMNEIVTRRSFLDRRACIESTLRLKFVKDQEERLMSSILPEHIVSRVRHDIREMILSIQSQKLTENTRSFNQLYVEGHDNVSILYADVVNYTMISTTLAPLRMVELLNELFGRFDEASEEHDVLRIKFLGDCYYCVSGIPEPNSQHAKCCVDLGLEMISIIKDVREKRSLNMDMRIGVHSGRVLSGLVGMRKWQYDIWSKDATIANKMESTGKAGKVHITKQTLEQILDHARDYIIEPNFDSQNHPFIVENKLETYLLSRPSRSTGAEYRPFRRPSVGLNRMMKRPSNNANGRRSENRGAANMRRTTSFMDENLVEYQQMLKAADAQMAKEIEDMTSGKEQLKQEAKLDKYSLMYKNMRVEKSYLLLPDPLFKYYITCCLIIFVLVSTINILTTVWLQGFKWYAWLVFTVLLVILIIMQPLTWFHFLWTKYKSIEEPQNKFLRQLYDNAAKIIRSAKIRATIYLVLSLGLAASSIVNVISCDEFFIDDSELGVFSCISAWHVTQCWVLVLLLNFLFSRVFFIFKWIVAGGMTMFYLWIVWETKTDLFIEDSTWNVGMDPRISHTLSVVFITVTLYWIDRTTEYRNRLDNLWQIQLKDEQLEEETMLKVNNLLLENILPAHVVQIYLDINRSLDELYYEKYDNVAVMFASLTDYKLGVEDDNELGDKLVLGLLDEVISDIDRLLLTSQSDHKVEKIKMAGWTYMAACGLDPSRRDSFDTMSYTSLIDNRQNSPYNKAIVVTMVEFAAAMMMQLHNFKKTSFQSFEGLNLRIGVSNGPVAAGVVGSLKPLYDIWGHAVNMASRMDSTGETGKIQVTENTAITLDECGILTRYRGKTFVKGAGYIKTYFVPLDDNFSLIRKENSSQYYKSEEEKSRYYKMKSVLNDTESDSSDSIVENTFTAFVARDLSLNGDESESEFEDNSRGDSEETGDSDPEVIATHC